MKSVRNIKERLNWLVVLGTITLLVCGPLSMLPAICLSEKTPDAKLYLGIPTDPVWVMPWLYYFSMAMHYLAIAGIVAVVIGVVLAEHKDKSQK